MKIFKPCAFNEIGRRDNQEDSLFPAVGKATTEDHLFVVCDGMGGHEKGEVASNSVCKSFSEFLKNTDPQIFTSALFSKALGYAYDELDRLDADYAKSAKKPGTTLTFVYLNDSGAFAAHIGDSRIYHLRKNADGSIKIIYKSQDHSLVNELVRAGVITEEEAVNHPRKNVITRAMQPFLENRYKATPYETNDVVDGDYFFMCSDGVLETIDDKLLCDILATDASDEEKMDKIKSMCGMNSHDNHTAYLIHVEKGLTKERKPIASSMVEQPIESKKTVPQEMATMPVVKKNNSNKKLLLLSLAAVVVVGLTTFAALTFWSNTSEKSEKTVVNQSPLGKPDGVVLPNPHIQQTPSQNQQQSVATQNVNQVDVTTGQTAEANSSENVDANAFTVLHNVVDPDSSDEVEDQIVDTVLFSGANVSIAPTGTEIK